jgi:tetratricopeptide (TPR) repeat protein
VRRAARILLSALALGVAASPLAGAVTAQPIIVGERTPAKTYALGQLALMRGDLSLAVRDLAEALRQNPSDVVLRRRVFELSLAAGDFVRALPLARQIIAEDPSNGFANYVLIADAARRGDWKSIDGRVNQLTTVGLDAALAPVIRAWSLRGQGRDAAADEALAVLDRTPSLRSLRALHQAYLDAARGQTEAALTAMTIALADSRLADARVLQSAAALHQQRKAFPDARALLSRDRAPERPARLSQALELLNSGYALGLAVANPREAMADAFLRASLESRTNSIMPTPVMLAQLSAWITPSVPEAWLRLSSTLNEVGADGAALAVLDNVPRDGALRLSADLQRAQLLEASGQATRALDLLDAMAKAQPARADIALLRADMLRRAGRYADAAPAYTAAMAV